jgi:hypothetical protein
MRSHVHGAALAVSLLVVMGCGSGSTVGSNATSCANGEVTANCLCGTTAVTSGYCCNGTVQVSACTALQQAGNPDGRCSLTLPPEARAVDTSTATPAVGTGTAESCTHESLAAAVARGGVITFDCGPDPVTIPVTATLELRTDRSTVIDGGNRVTLDGGGSVRILRWNSGNWMTNDNVLTLQHLVLANGRATGTELIPTRPEPCSQGYNDGQGGALFMRDGVLHAIDVTFMNNRAAELGPDTGGGAIYLLGTKPAYISGCTFMNNRASNAGAMGSLFAENYIYDSLFDGNVATGHGANNDDPDQCTYVNNGQHQVGSGGNGGAIYSDGVGVSMTICGTQVRNNAAGAFGAAIFFTSNDGSNLGTLTIRDSLLFGNTPANDWWEWRPGISTNARTVDPIDSDIR